MRRYAFEALVFHSLWFLFLFAMSGGFSMPFTASLDELYQWDARWYGIIALDGHGFHPQSFVFPPLNGWLLGVITEPLFQVFRMIIPDLRWVHVFGTVSFIVGISLFALGNALVVALASRRWNIDRRTLWMIAISNPVGYFALTAYSDMFFFAVMMAIVWLALWTSPRREAWRLRPLSKNEHRAATAGLTALLFTAPWIRLTGFAFAAWALLKRREIVATLLSLTCFLIYYEVRTGNPFFFLFIQSVFQMPEGYFPAGAHQTFALLFHVHTGDPFRALSFFIHWMNFGLLPGLCFVFSIGLAGWFFRKREYELATLVLAVVAISHNQAFWRSTVRYTLPFFPFFYWPLIIDRERAEKTGMRIFIAILLGLSFTLQVMYCRQFRAGMWAF